MTRSTVTLLSLVLFIGCGSTPQPMADEPSAEAPIARTRGPERAERGVGPRAGPGMGPGRGPGMGRGPGAGRAGEMGGGSGGMGRGNGRGGPGPELRADFHALLDSHDAIERRVEMLPDGVETITTSDDPEVVAVLRRHVKEINEHVSTGGRVRQWDPLFAALVDHASETEMSIREIPGGIAVTHRGTTPEAVALIKAHAQVVSDFAARGHEEAQREHPLPY